MSDVTVVGAGLIGSAAARHLAESGLVVTLVGPPEGNPNLVHASHYDEARITRQIGTDPVWSNLARDAMHRYGEIESSSGIRFHRTCGHLRCDLPSEHPQSAWDLVRKVCRQRRITGAERSHEEIRRRFPELAFQANSRFHWEGGPAGIINPRRLVEAQISLAKRAGTTVIRDVAVQVEKQGSAYAVRDSRGNARISEKVLVAAGAYTNRFDLTPAKLALDVRPETVILARVGGGLSSSLADTPSIVWRYFPHSGRCGRICIASCRISGRMSIRKDRRRPRSGYQCQFCGGFAPLHDVGRECSNARLAVARVAVPDSASLACTRRHQALPAYLYARRISHDR